MFQLFFAIFLALSPAHSHAHPTNGNGTQVSTSNDTGGETEPIPPKPPHHP